MPQTPHIEKHFTSGEVIRDVVIGMADGLTVPFALAAGLSGAVSSTTIIVTAGLAEIVASSIAMGLGGYLAGKSDIEHFDSEYKCEMYEIEEMLEHENDEVVEILEDCGLTRAESLPIVESLAARPKDFADFMMRLNSDLKTRSETPSAKRRDYRRRVYFRRFDSACSIYDFAGSAHCSSLVGCDYSYRAVCFRLCKRHFYRHKTFQKHDSNLSDRKCGGRHGIFGCAADWRMK